MVPVFKIFQSLGSQELTFPTTVPLDCLWEELSGSQYYSVFFWSNCILNFRSVSIPGKASKKEFFYVVFLPYGMCGRVPRHCGFFFFFFHLKPELISSIRDPANCPQSYMTNSFLHLLFKKKTTITTKTEKRLVKTFLFVKFEILPRKVLK